MTASKASATRSTFYFPEQMDRWRSGDQPARLLWRILQTQPEVRGGQVHVLRQPFFKAIRDREDEINLEENIARNIGLLLKKSARSRLEESAPFIMRVAAQFRREVLLLRDPGHRCALDILFQTIQLISLNASRDEANSVIQQLGTRYPNSSITPRDREMLHRNFRAYLFLIDKVRQIKSLRQTLDLRDDLITAMARRFPDTSIFVLDNMLRYIVAQILLARKYRCDTLIVEWMKEYGFGPEQMVRISRYVPYDSEFLKFRSIYRAGVRSLKDDRDATRDSDLHLLRSLSLFYTSWIMKTSEQLAAS